MPHLHLRNFVLALLAVFIFALAGGPAVAQSADDYKGDPYTIGVCPVSGEVLGSMGDPILLNHEGRDIRFCCAGCPPKFKSDPGQFLSKIDDLMIEAQKGYYPLDTDIVSGDALGDAPVDIVYNNRLVRFSSQMSAQKFHRDPGTFLAKLDEAVIAKQVEGYPLDTCVISGEPLTVMGEPIQLVAANRLVQFCCAGCVDKFWKDPHGTFQKIDGGTAGSEEGSDHNE